MHCSVISLSVICEMLNKDDEEVVVFISWKPADHFPLFTLYHPLRFVLAIPCILPKRITPTQIKHILKLNTCALSNIPISTNVFALNFLQIKNRDRCNKWTEIAGSCNSIVIQEQQPTTEITTDTV